jgi:hypothetical protein
VLIRGGGIGRVRRVSRQCWVSMGDIIAHARAQVVNHGNDLVVLQFIFIALCIMVWWY